jgi:hypothetical protein
VQTHRAFTLLFQHNSSRFSITEYLSPVRRHSRHHTQAIAVAAVQLAAGTVASLDLSGCGLSPTHVPRLQSLLLPSAGPAASGLAVLVLADNPLGNTGFSALAACLCGEYSGFHALRRLEVSGCGLGIIAADAIGGILRRGLSRALLSTQSSRPARDPRATHAGKLHSLTYPVSPRRVTRPPCHLLLNRNHQTITPKTRRPGFSMYDNLLRARQNVPLPQG